MKSLELLDSWISAKVRSWSSRVSGEARAPELLEIRRDLLNHVRDQIQPKGNGRFLFPYRTIEIQLAPATESQAQLFESTLAESDALEQDFRSLLAEAGCPIPEGFSVEASVIDEPALAATSQPYRIRYTSRPSAQTAEALPAVRPKAKLTVLQGEAEPTELSIEADKLHLGRLREVMSETGSLRRRNDIAFAESETTVSREHAYISYDPEAGAFRLHDGRNQRGTSVFRESREIRVPKGSSRGLELRSGDEIHLGQARLRFETS